MVRERVQSIRYSTVRQAIVGGGRKGGLFLFNHKLELIQEGPVTMYNGALTAMEVTDENIFTRDVFGNVIRWDLHTLHPIDVLITDELKDDSELHEEDCTMPCATHALAVRGKYLYTINSYGQLLEIEVDGLKLNRILDPSKDAYMECLEFAGPDVDVFSDFSGYVSFGSLETGEFPKKTFLSEGPVHRVAYDSRHNRYWATNENNNGIYILGIDGEVLRFLPVAEDDMEWIEFNEDASLAYVVTFDRHFYVYSNVDEEPKLLRVVGPFKFHLMQIVCVSDDNVYVLLTSGEMYRINKRGEICEGIDYKGNSVWGMDVHPGNGQQVYLSMEDGSVAIVEVDIGSYQSVELKQVNRYFYGFHRVRRVKALSDGSFLGGAADGTVFKATVNGELVWYKRILGCVRDMDLSQDFTKLLVGTEGNYAAEISVETGEILRDYKLAQPVWGVNYDRKGHAWIAEHQKMIKVFHAETGEQFQEVRVLDNTKNMRLLDNGNILMNGPEGAAEINTETFAIEKRWTDWLTATTEDAMEFEGYMYAVLYSNNLNMYRNDEDECIHKQVSVSDFPKQICALKTEPFRILLVAGRGAYVTAFRLENGIPHKTREMYF